eukprot:NODE_544_length_6231_cov_0.089693.p5 type:complete len:134 gc:universal NODE_544_length_6231_cov_0.089693:1379-978(-)
MINRLEARQKELNDLKEQIKAVLAGLGSKREEELNKIQSEYEEQAITQAGMTDEVTMLRERDLRARKIDEDLGMLKSQMSWRLTKNEEELERVNREINKYKLESDFLVRYGVSRDLAQSLVGVEEADLNTFMR